MSSGEPGARTAASFGVGAVVLLAASSAWCTDIAAGTYPAQTWAASGSPYHVVGRATFEALTIEPGTSVTIAPHMAVMVTGILTAVGTRSRRISISGEETTDAPPTALRAGSADVAFVTVRNLGTGLSVSSGGTIRSSRFEGCTVGLDIFGPTSLDGIAVVENQIGMFVNGHGTTIVNSLIAENVGTGVVGETQMTIANTTFDRNGTGYETRGFVEVTNSILTNNHDGVFFSLPGSTPTHSLSYSNLWGNDVDIAGQAGSLPGTGNISLDPKFVSATDRHLLAASPCIDSASGVGAPNHDFDGAPRPVDGNGTADTDGSEFDMGAYEFGSRPGGGEGGTGEGGDGGTAGEGGESGMGGEAGDSDTGGTSSGAGGNGHSTGGISSDAGTLGGASGTSSTSGTAGVTLGGATSGGAAASGSASAGSTGGNDDAAGDKRNSRTEQTEGCGCRVAPGHSRATSLGALLVLALLTRRRKSFSA